MERAFDNEGTGGELAAGAAGCLAEALALRSAPRRPGQRERYRALLEQAIDQARRAAAAGTSASTEGVCSTLATALAARAEDALQGAGQLSLSAQRAPTPEACDEGWARVEAIVAGAVEAAREAAAVGAQPLARERAPMSRRASPHGALSIDEGPRIAVARAAERATHRAEAAARAARRIVEQRNHAYTFHASPGFSFGEGWYLAAAAVLGGVAIQIEPAAAATSQAEHFLRQAGLGGQLVPYRARPRANKATTAIVARAFRADPPGAQRALRAALLGDEPIAEAVRAFVDARLAAHRGRPKVLLWIRDGAHHPGRNTELAELVELTRCALGAGLVPVLVGDALRAGEVPAGAVDLILFWRDPVFRGIDGRRAQLQFFEHVRRAHGVVGQVGVTTAGMDGPALLGMPTIYLTGASNVRMREWVGAVPGYQEVVREPGYLEVVRRQLAAWARTSTPGEPAPPSGAR